VAQLTGEAELADPDMWGLRALHIKWKRFAKSDPNYALRFKATAAYLRMVYVELEGKVSTSEKIANVQFEGKKWAARNIREWARMWLQCRAIPRSQQGANTKTRSLLDEEVFRSMCMKYLTSVKKTTGIPSDMLVRRCR